MNTPDVGKLTIQEVISRICTLNEGIREFWTVAHGWAPDETASLLSRSRLDRQVSLSHCLTLWEDEHPPERREGARILGWANLGSLVEGTMKWFLSVYRKDYPEGDGAITRHGKIVEPEAAMLDELRKFFFSHVWIDSEKDEWDSWLCAVRDRRNAVHAYKDREVGDVEDLHEGIRKYLLLLRTAEGRVPYPDGVYGPYESVNDL
jgi:hypothetical protein